MKILVVSNFYPPRAVGGAEIVAHRYALELMLRGHEVQAFAGRVPKPEQKGGELELEIVDGVTVHLLSIRSLEADRAFHWQAAGRRFRAVLEHFGPDVVHFHNLNGLGANLVLEARRAGIKTICTLHDHWGFCARNTRLLEGGRVCEDLEACHHCVPNVLSEAGQVLPYRLRRDFVFFALSLVDLLVFPSRYLAETYRRAGFPASKIRVQSNGVEVERFGGPRADVMKPLRIAFVGHLGAHKGISVLLDAIDRLLRRPGPKNQWSMSIAGDGNLRSIIEEFTRDPARRENVRFLGKVAEEEMPGLMRETDVILLPSIWPENEPVVMLEAAAAGAAQLASRIGGVPELVDDGESGLLFEAGSASDLADKLGRYIDDPALARRHGAFNALRRNHFAQSKSIDVYEALYQEPAPVDDGSDEAVVVLCDGTSPPLEVAHFFNNFSLFERGRKVRFIYIPWADASLWRSASAIFVWSGETSPEVLLRANRLGIPMLGPAGNQMIEALAKEGGLAMTYSDFAEAIAAILSMKPPVKMSMNSGRERENACLATGVAASIDSHAFALSAEIPFI